MSLAAEFGEFGADDESVTGLKAATKAKKEKKKKKPKKKAVIEASENPLSNSDEEEEQADALPEGTPPEKSKGKKKGGKKKKKAVAEFTEMEIESDEDIEDEIASRVQEAQVQAAMAGKKSKKMSKKEKKAAAAASDMVNPMADEFDEAAFMQSMESSEGGASEESVGWILGIDTGKKKQPIVSRYVRVKGAGTQWALLVYKDESSADGKPLHGMKLNGAAFQFGVRTVEGREMHNLVAGKVQLAFTKAADKDVGSVDKKSGKVSFVGRSPTEMLSAFVVFLMSKRVGVVDENGEPIGAGGIAEEDITVTYNHEGSRAPDIVWREHESGFLRVEDAYGMAAKCPGMKLGLELRQVAGKPVGGIPQSMLKQIVQTEASPVEMVFIEPDDLDEEEESEEEEEEEPVDCVFHESGSIGIVFDEGEEDDTVIIDSIKKGTPASRRYGGQLEEGMLLTKCRGQDTGPLDFDAIIALITDPSRPLEMTFEFLYEEDSE